MSAWEAADLDRFARAEEVDLAPRRQDGSFGKPVTIWAVAHDDALWVRSAVRGREAAWYRSVQATHLGRISASRIEKEVELVDADAKVADAIDAAYREKYRRYAGRILDSCLTEEARATTLKVMPVEQASR